MTSAINARWFQLFMGRLFCLAVFSCLVCHIPAAQGQGLVSYEAAAPLGLERAWFAQVRVDQSRHHVTGWTLFEDNLLALTDGGLVESFNAETGEVLWTSQAAPIDRKASGPAADKKYVALVSGATLYVLDRSNGRLLFSRALATAPAAAPALCDNHAYVTFLNGRVEGHNLEDPTASTWYFQSVGRIFHSPSASGKLVSWPTNRGYLYAGQATSPRVLYRIQTQSPATTPPTEAAPLVYIATADGHVYCFEHLNGHEKWRYSMGFPATGRPAAVGERLYVASSEPRLHALDTKTGKEFWSIDGVTGFAAQGVHNVYGLDDLGRVVVCDKADGHFVGMLPGLRYESVFNDQSDRLFLVSRNGLVQCLRERDAVEPTMYRQEIEQETEETEEPSPETTPTVVSPTVPESETPATETAEPSPFNDESNAAGDNPFEF